ncbi:hypothetical protein, partial [Herbaspirillum sp. B65]|uniref:hypothetical protein n=1 Tax=Herbaspirillum sp. B65 TaxID=137708 RepID=UPI0005C85F23
AEGLSQLVIQGRELGIVADGFSLAEPALLQSKLAACAVETLRLASRAALLNRRTRGRAFMARLSVLLELMGRQHGTAIPPPKRGEERDFSQNLCT